MVLTKEFLEKLIPVFEQESVSEETELVYDGHHFDAELDKNEDDKLVIIIRYNREESLRSKFEEWCDTLDDELFLEACEKFEEITGTALKDVNDEDSYSDFQKVVKEIVKNKIENLQRYL